MEQALTGKHHVRFADKRRRHFLMRIDHYGRSSRRQHRQRLGISRNHQIRAQQKINLTGGDSHPVNVLPIR